MFINHIAMLDTLFPKTSKEDMEKVIDVIENKAPLYGIKTDLDLAHFLAQVRIEIGARLKPKRESLNYKADVLPKVFRYYRLYQDEAFRDGRTLSNRANQVNIANKVYANRLGNGSAATNDGWNYRGAGFIQVTGKTNFRNTQIRINRYDKNTSIDIVNKNDIDTLEGAIVSGFAFWIWKDINLLTIDKSSETVNNITSVINYHTHTYNKRLAMFKKISHLC